MSTSHSRQDHGSRLPPRTVHATTRGRTRVKNDKLRTSIQDLMVSPLFASLKKNGKAKRLSCSYSWTFATCPPTCGRALMRARKNVPPEIRLTEPRMPTAASNAREQKKKKTVGFGNSLGQPLLLLAQTLEQWRWSKARSDRKNTTHFFTLTTTTTTSPPPAWSARPAGLGGPP